METEEDIRVGVRAAQKRLIIRGLAIGAGCGLMLATVFLIFNYVASRPKGWDVRSLRVAHPQAQPLMRMDEHLNSVSSGVILSFDLENTTGTDIKLPGNSMIMQTSKGSAALHPSLLRLNQKYFIPAHHSVVVSLENDELCTPDMKPHDCFNGTFKDEGEIVIFEDGPKYEIHIPIPALKTGVTLLNTPQQ
jgi:hypothetical protein